MDQQESITNHSGNKNHFGLNWGDSVASGRVSHFHKVDDHVIAAASREYSLILCLDPVMFAQQLHRCNLPVMAVATPKELHEYPEILKVLDYLLPAPSSRHDAALGELIRRQVGAPGSAASSGRK